MKTKMDKRKINRKVAMAIARMNRVIEEDELWLGRFVARKIDAQYFEFSDLSGGILYVLVRFIDKKTGKTEDVWLEAINEIMFFENHLFEELNDFIIETCDVWSEDPRNNIIDFREVKV